MSLQCCDALSLIACNVPNFQESISTHSNDHLVIWAKLKVPDTFHVALQLSYKLEFLCSPNLNCFILAARSNVFVVRAEFCSIYAFLVTHYSHLCLLDNPRLLSFFFHRCLAVPYLYSVVTGGAYKLVTSFRCKVDAGNVLGVTLVDCYALESFVWFETKIILPKSDLIIFCSTQNVA